MPRKRPSTSRSSTAIVVVVFGALANTAVSPAGTDEAKARIAPGAYQRVNESLARHHILPRYRQFFESTVRFREAVGALCEFSGEGSPKRARDAYHEAMDDWMAMQHLQFGPLEQKLRAHRVYFWPQARGKVAEAIAELISGGGDGDILSPERFSGTSVAVQGLPAAEYLLFVRGDALAAADEAERAECRVLEAVSRNLEEIAQEALEEWSVAAGRWDNHLIAADVRAPPEDR